MATSMGTIGLDLVVNKGIFNKQLSGLNKEAGKAGKGLSSTLSKSFGGVTSAAKKAAMAMAAAFSVKKIIDFGKESMAAAEVQQTAETRLETVMKQRMKATDAAVQSVKDFASAQQQIGVVGDEVQLSGAQQLATFLNTDSALKKLIPAMNNLAVQQNGVNVSAESMTNIGNLMGKAMQGQAGALTRVGITFSEAQEKVLKYGSEEERAATLAQVITDNVGEMNKALAATPSGQIQQIKNNFGDMMETVGMGLQNLIQPLLKYVNLLVQKFSTLASSFKSFTEMLTGNKAQSSALGKVASDSSGLSDTVSNLEDNTAGVGKAAQKAAKEMKALMGFDQINRIGDPSEEEEDSADSGLVPDTDFGNLAEGETVLDDLNGKLDGTLDRFKELAGLFKKGFDLGFGDTNLDGLIKQFKRVGKALKDIFTDKRVTDAAKRMVDQLVETLGTADGSFARIAVKWGEAIFAGIADALERDKEWIVNKLVEIMDTITEILKQISHIFQTLADIFTAPQVLENLRGLADSITSCLTTAALTIADIATKIGLAIITGIADSLEKNKQWIIDKLTSILDTMAQIFDQIKNGFLILGEIFTAPQVLESIRGLSESITTALTVAVFTIADAAVKIGLAIVTGIVDSLEKNKQWITDKLADILNTFTQFFDQITRGFLILGEVFTAPQVLEAIRGLSESITTYLTVLYLSIADTAAKIGLAMITGIVDSLEKNKQWLIDSLTWLLDAWNGIYSDMTEIVLDIAGILTSGDFLGSVQTAAEKITTAFMQVVFSVGSIGTTIAQNLVGGIKLYLDQNSEFIKNALIGCVDCVGDFSEITGQLALAVADIFTVFSGDNAKQITADLIGIFSNNFLSVAELAGKFATDLIDMIAAPIVENKDKIKEAIDNTLAPISEVIHTIKDTLTEAWTKIGEMYDEHIGPMFDSFRDGFSEILGTLLDGYNKYIAPVLDRLADKFKVVWEEHIKPVVDKAMELVGHIADGLKEMWEKTLKPIVKWIAENIMPVVAPVLEVLGDVFLDTFGEIADIVGDVMDALGGLFDFIEGLVTGDSDKALGGLKKLVNALISGLNDLISIPFNGINSILKKVKDVEVFGFKPFDWIKEIPVPQIPKLAEGGYIKANTPQLAMIGDNKHQGEVVAPEDKLLEMAKMAANMSGGGNSTLLEILTILKEIYNYMKANGVVVIDPESLRKYFVKETNKRTISAGVCELKT